MKYRYLLGRNNSNDYYLEGFIPGQIKTPYFTTWKDEAICFNTAEQANEYIITNNLDVDDFQIIPVNISYFL